MNNNPQAPLQDWRNSNNQQGANNQAYRQPQQNAGRATQAWGQPQYDQPQQRPQQPQQPQQQSPYSPETQPYIPQQQPQQQPSYGPATQPYNPHQRQPIGLANPQYAGQQPAGDEPAEVANMKVVLLVFSLILFCPLGIPALIFFIKAKSTAAANPAEAIGYAGRFNHFSRLGIKIGIIVYAASFLLGIIGAIAG